ncbi:TPA: AbgT family transporter, partial [Serratia liquefaciens]
QLGTYYVLILPYPLVFFAVWILLLLTRYALGLPIGPGVYPKMG